jgi:outer membrane protein assembly factor BamA
MPLKRLYNFLIIFTMSGCQYLVAQQPGNEPSYLDSVSTISTHVVAFQVGDIIITGNKKTRSFIIEREIPFKKGEEYPLQDLVKKFEDARRQLMNTTLFNSVIVAAGSFEGNIVNVKVDVKERWYLFPVPYFKPVDRNLNQWLIEQNASLSRVNYGLKILYNNASGRNDKLRLAMVLGYTKQASLSYDRLYIDKSLKWGMKVNFAVGSNKEINYNTIKDKQVFLKENKFVRKFLNTSAELTYRRAIKTRHSFGISYNTEEVGDTIINLNPSYFKNGRNRISFPGLYYTMSYLDLDYIPYPTKGYAAYISVGKGGFSKEFDVWHLHAKGSGTWPLFPKTFLNINVYGGIKLPFKQPYFNQRFLGYNDVFMQGYEYYVMDGVAGGYLKTTLTRELIDFKIRIPLIQKGKQSQYIPFRIFGKVFGNSGYVHNPQPGDNALSNKMLYSGGFGIDILSFYDVTFKLEYTFNQLGQNGLFLHRKSIF